MSQPMRGTKRAVPMRVIFVALGTVALGFAVVVTLQLLTVLRPAVADLRGLAGDVLSDQAAIEGNLAGLREARRQIARLAPPVDRSAGALPNLEQLRNQVRSLLDSSAAVRASVERANVPMGMRLLLADAVQQEASVGVQLMEAIRAIELNRPRDAVDALRASGVHSDSTTQLLSAAQRVALQDILVGQERLLDRLVGFERWGQGWAVLGILLFALGAWIVHVRVYTPIGALERVVQQVAAGNLEAEVPVPRDDELGRLSAHVNAMTGVLRDRAAEESRRRENLTERFGRILDESSNQICVFDASSLALVQANRGARVALGYSREEISGLRLHDLFGGMPEERLESLLEGLRAGSDEPVLLSTWLRRRDGSLHPAEMTLQHATDGGSPVFITVAEDAGLRHRVRDLDERLREFTLMEQEALTGPDPESVLHPLTVMAADALQATGCGIWRTGAMQSHCVVAYDVRSAYHRSDAPFPSESESPLRAPVRTGARVDAQLVITHEEERRVWTAEERTFAGAVADLVARVLEAAERRTLEHALERAQRMDSIGQLAGGVAHDFNNILTAILGNLEACRGDLPPGSPMDAALAEAEHAALRAADLTKQLLTFARHQVVETRIVDLAERARESEPILRRLLGPEWELRIDHSAAPTPVRLGVGQVEQLLVNLVVNARDAMPEGGPIYISTRTLLIASTEEQPGLVPGPHVALRVRDEGIGMDQRTVERVFEPFFTTKRLGEGTGLGLSVCYGIVRNAHGVIRVVSAPGKGTTFDILLPEAVVRPSPPSGSPMAGAAGGGEVILLAEDEPAIRTLMTRMLVSRGFRVLAAEDGEQALAIAARHEGSIALFVSDVVMPRLGGVDAARKLRLARPDIPVLFMSGFTATTAVQEGDLADAGFLAKPFTPDELGRRVRDMLDADRAAREAAAR
jgi:PAS domain S-box-containing protein